MVLDECCATRVKYLILAFFSMLLLSTVGKAQKLERQWYIGGLFNRVWNNERSLVAANNIAKWNGNRFLPMGSGTNGEVKTIFTDSCLNIFIGGNFSKSGNRTTGPIAKWTTISKDWEPIFQTETVFEGPVNYVNSISTECFNRGPSFSNCYCDVYFGGLFRLIDVKNNRTLVNIARWDSRNRQWFDLDGANSGIDSDTEVYSVSKREYGFVEAVDALFVGVKDKGLKIFNFRAIPYVGWVLW